MEEPATRARHVDPPPSACAFGHGWWDRAGPCGGQHCISCAVAGGWTRLRLQFVYSLRWRSAARHSRHSLLRTLRVQPGTVHHPLDVLTSVVAAHLQLLTGVKVTLMGPLLATRSREPAFLPRRCINCQHPLSAHQMGERSDFSPPKSPQGTSPPRPPRGIGKRRRPKHRLAPRMDCRPGLALTTRCPVGNLSLVLAGPSGTGRFDGAFTAASRSTPLGLRTHACTRTPSCAYKTRVPFLPIRRTPRTDSAYDGPSMPDSGRRRSKAATKLYSDTAALPEAAATLACSLSSPLGAGKDTLPAAAANQDGWALQGVGTPRSPRRQGLREQRSLAAKN